MKKTMFHEDLTDKELFAMLRPGFPCDECCWEAVKEAQWAYRCFVRDKYLNEDDDYSISTDLYAA